MREIGGYFGLEQFAGCEYYPALVGVNSGRNALLYILKVRGYRKLYIPRFLCDSVAALCRREGYAYEEYAIDENFLPVFAHACAADEAIYIVNFYGQISDAALLDMKDRWSNIIFDNVQAFFRKPLPGIDTVYSCRKFFGVPDGGYAACEGATLQLEQDASRDRMTHILGRFEDCGSAFYGAFQENDDRFYHLPLRAMSRLTRNILRGVDYESVRQKRNENYAVLSAALDGKNSLMLKGTDGPYCYPFYCKNGMQIKRRLAERKIYVPTLWPNVREYEGTLEKDYAENILPLPCDQRYSVEDMEHIVEELRRCIED